MVNQILINRVAIRFASIAFAMCFVVSPAYAEENPDQPSSPPATGTRRLPFRCILKSPGGALPFNLMLIQPNGADGWTALIQNGEETVQLQDVEFDNARLHISFPHYDAHITALKQDDGTYAGRWFKTTGPDKQSELPFTATPNVEYRFPPSTRKAGDQRLAYSWRVKFAKSDDDAVGLFSQSDNGVVTGTFVTTTGDYRFLAGDFDGKRLRLSSFDGAHAFLFSAILTADGTLKGDFWSRDTWHETWTAKPDESGLSVDPWQLTKPRDNVDLASVKFRDLDGNIRSLGDDPAWAGKPRIIEISGSWCPNCHDAAKHLEKLYQKHQGDGLVVMSLMFEVTGNFKRDAQQVRRFRARHNLTYPLLVAGKADRERVADQVQLIDELKSYPTLIFVDRNNRVEAIYTGYAGPATGKYQEAQNSQIATVIGRLMAK